MTEPLVIDRDVLTLKQAAEYLQVGPRTVRRLLRSGKIVGKKIDGRGTLRIAKTTLLRYVEGGAQ